MTVAIDTPEGIAFAQMLAFRGRLNLEVQGFKSRVNTIQSYNRVYGTAFKTRKKALVECEARIFEVNQRMEENRAKREEIAAKSAGIPWDQPGATPQEDLMAMAVALEDAPVPEEWQS